MSDAAIGGDGDAGGGFGKADLGIGQVAAGVLRPRIAGDAQRPHPGVAAADVEMAARPAAPADRPRPPLQARHDRIAEVVPDRRKRPLLHIAQRIVPPHRVGMHIPYIVDIGDVHPR